MTIARNSDDRKSIQEANARNVVNQIIGWRYLGSVNPEAMDPKLAFRHSYDDSSVFNSLREGKIYQLFKEEIDYYLDYLVNPTVFSDLKCFFFSLIGYM